MSSITNQGLNVSKELKSEIDNIKNNIAPNKQLPALFQLQAKLQVKIGKEEKKLEISKKKIIFLKKREAAIKYLFVKQFYKSLGIKYPETSEEERINKIVSKYFNKSDFSMRNGHTFMINSMNPFITYLKEHPTTTKINFTPYTSVKGIDEFTKFVQKNRHNLKLAAVAFQDKLRNNINNKTLENVKVKVFFIKTKN